MDWCSLPPPRSSSKWWNRPSAAAAMLAALALSALPARAQSPGLNDVLENLSTYLSRYSEQLTRTIANEHYKQTTGSGPTYQEAVLDSEYGVLKIPGYQGWLGFRDVLKVNGREAGAHESQLEQLLLDPAPVPINQARRIAEASAVHNIGALQRNINNP